MSPVSASPRTAFPVIRGFSAHIDGAAGVGMMKAAGNRVSAKPADMNTIIKGFQSTMGSAQDPSEVTRSFSDLLSLDPSSYMASLPPQARSGSQSPRRPLKCRPGRCSSSPSLCKKSASLSGLSNAVASMAGLSSASNTIDSRVRRDSKGSPRSPKGGRSLRREASASDLTPAQCDVYRATVERTKDMQERITAVLAQDLARDPATATWSPPAMPASSSSKPKSPRRSPRSPGRASRFSYLPGQRQFSAMTVESVLEEDEDDECGGGSAVVMASPDNSPRAGAKAAQVASPRSGCSSQGVVMLCKSEADPLSVSAAVKRAVAHQVAHAQVALVQQCGSSSCPILRLDQEDAKSLVLSGSSAHAPHLP